jgi:hypothetical protein
MTSSERARLARILGMLGSEYPGEQAAAASQAEAFRKRHGLTWEAMLSLPAVTERPEPPPRDASKEAENAVNAAAREAMHAAYRAAARERIREAEERRANAELAALNERLNASEIIVVRNYGRERVDAEVEYFKQRCEADPLLWKQLHSKRNPYQWMIDDNAIVRPRSKPEPPPRFDPPLPWVPPRPPRPLPFERIWRPKLEMAMSPRGLVFALIGIWVISIAGVIAEKF